MRLLNNEKRREDAKGEMDMWNLEVTLWRLKECIGKIECLGGRHDWKVVARCRIDGSRAADRLRATEYNEKCRRCTKLKNRLWLDYKNFQKR